MGCILRRADEAMYMAKAAGGGLMGRMVSLDGDEWPHRRA